MSNLHDLDPIAELPLVPGFAEIGEDALAEVAAHVTQRRVRVGEVIAEQGQVAHGVLVLVRGAAKSVRTVEAANEGVARVLDVMRAPSIIADASAFDGLPSDASVLAIRSSHIFVLERRALQRAMAAHPALDRALFSRFLREVRSQVKRIDELASGSVEERIHRLLEALALHHGTPLGQGRFIALPLRRKDLASMVNATTETVSRLLAKLEREGRARSTRDGIWWRGATRGAAVTSIRPQPKAVPV